MQGREGPRPAAGSLGVEQTMDQDLNTIVEAYRRRLGDAGADVQRLEDAAVELEEQVEEGAPPEAAESLRRARADLARAEHTREAIQREYAVFRLREALGSDPGYLDRDLFDEELIAITQGRLVRRDPRDPRDGEIGFESFRAMLLSDLGLDQLADNERAERRGAGLHEFHEHSGTQAILRQWAARLRSDPHVSSLMDRAADAASRFSDRLAEFTRSLDNLRINYEISKRQVDQLTFACDAGRPAIHAANYWENVEELFAQESGACLGSFLALEQARDEVRRLREELNAALRAFLSAFVPRYITYASRQSKARRLRLGLRRFGARRLCDYLLDEIERTDFLLPRGGGIEVAVPRIPRAIAQFRKLKAFRDYKKALERAALSNAPTVAEGTE